MGKNQNTLLWIGLAALALMAFSKRKKRPVIEVHPLDKGEFVPDRKGVTDVAILVDQQPVNTGLSNTKKVIIPPAPPVVDDTNIDFLQPYRRPATLAGCATC